MFTELSSMWWILFGIIILAVVVIIWKWWNKPNSLSKKDDALSEHAKMITEETHPPPSSISNTDPPPMVFAVNDQGNLDLTDMSGNILNIGYGPNPKTYIGLLDKAERDTNKIESDTGIIFTSKVGTTKSYEIVGRPYIINYSRL